MANQLNSRLGQILVNKGLITPQQLDAAIKMQLTSKLRLGEVLVAQGLLTQKQLLKALRKQSNLRLAATLVAALMSPLQLASADIQRLQPPASISRQETPQGLLPLTDLEMSNVSAQGLEDVWPGPRGAKYPLHAGKKKPAEANLGGFSGKAEAIRPASP